MSSDTNKHKPPENKFSRFAGRLRPCQDITIDGSPGNLTPMLLDLARQLQIEDWVIWATAEDKIQYERDAAR